MTKVRIVLRFGFSFCSVAGCVRALAGCVLAAAAGVLSLAGCAPANPHVLAREDDGRYRTAIFTWLVEHEPSAVVAWHVPVATVQALLPESRIFAAATTKVCAQASHSHALLLLVEPRTAKRDRANAEDCGFALERDAGAIVVAPR
jgi:hypothetical protein